MPDTDIAKPSFLDRRKDAALAEIRERGAEHRRIEEIVLAGNSRNRVTEVIRLEGDYLAQVEGRDGATTWTTVVNGERSTWHHHTQEEAILHLIARRYDPNPNSNASAAFYAGRVLGIPQTTDQ